MELKRRRAALRFFDDLGDKYQAGFAPSQLDARRLRADATYGLKTFLYRYAYERKDAPKGYPIAAAKAAEAASKGAGTIPTLFRTYWTSGPNKNANPALDARIDDLQIPSIVECVLKADLSQAFQLLRLRGAAHKICSFFLRDLVLLYDVEDQLNGTLSAYLYVQPVDTWVRMTADCIVRDVEEDIPSDMVASTYAIDRSDMRRAIKIIRASLDGNVSPLRVNQGMWYYASQVVHDGERLKHLLSNPDVGALRKELSLLRGFAPGLSWGTDSV